MALASVEDCASPNIKIARGGSWARVKYGVNGCKASRRREYVSSIFLKGLGVSHAYERDKDVCPYSGYLLIMGHS